MGREAKYDPELAPKLAESYAMEGWSDALIAEKLGINRTTLYKWQNRFPDLRTALKRGKEPVNAELKMAMIKSATGYFVDEEKTVTFLDVRTRQPKSFQKITTKRFIPPSPTTQIFLAKNRMPELFRDVNRYEITGSNGAPVVASGAQDLLHLSEEENTKDENNNYQVDDFIRNYLSVKQKAVPAEKKIYIAFKEYFENNISRSRDEERKFSTEDLLKDMRQYSRFYNILVTANHDDKRLSSCIERLNWLTTTVTRPFFLEVLRLNADKKLNIDDVVNIFLTIENYIVRRNICELPTNALNKMFVSLHNEIMKYDGTDENYFNKLKYALLTKKDNTALPDNEDFADNFVNRQIYSRNNKNKVLYILERLENFGTLETKNIYELFGKNDGYFIEHIMPQTLTTEWTKSLGDNYKRIYNNWLNKIANLTLTAYNSNYSNRPFTEKRDMQNGFKDSGFKINQWLANLDKWGETELETRSEMLKKRALEIWPMPETDFKPEQKPSNQYSLDDDVDLTWTTLKKFSYNDIEYNAKNWQDMYLQIIKALHSEDRTVLYGLAEDKKFVYASRSPENVKYYMQIDDDLYVWKNTSTKDKILILRKIFQHFKVDPSDLIFYIDVKKE